jgi:hypothetical protein
MISAKLPYFVAPVDHPPCQSPVRDVSLSQFIVPQDHRRKSSVCPTAANTSQSVPEGISSSFSSFSSTSTPTSEAELLTAKSQGEEGLPQTQASMRSSVFLTTVAIPQAQVMRFASAILEATAVRVCVCATQCFGNNV